MSNSKNTTKEKTKSNNKKQKDKQKSKIKYLSGMLFAKMMRGGASELKEKAKEVNELNVFPVPDGDTGDNMRMTLESGIAALESVNSDDLAEVMRVASRGMLLGARGNSGVILSQFFAGIAKGFESADKADAVALGRALEMGVEQAYTSVVTPTEGTILTVAREAVEYAVSRITTRSTVRTVFGDLVKEMHRSLKRTPEILTILKEAGVVDSGGAGLYYIMDGLNRVLNGEEIKHEVISEIEGAAQKCENGFGPDSIMTYGYCTELLVQLQSAKCDVEALDTEELKAELLGLGDSLILIKNDSIIKLHIHTMEPESVLKLLRKYGEFINVKIENMTIQHTKTEAERDVAIIAVSLGEGISKSLRELGADEIIDAADGQNPSTNVFLSAFERSCARLIYVFPNNSNIMMAATQAAQIYGEERVFVIPSYSIGACYSILSSIDIVGVEPDKVISQAEAVSERIATAHICPAARDAEIGGIRITEGESIGMIGKSICVSTPQREDALKKTVSALISGNDYNTVTIFIGNAVPCDEQDAIKKHIRENYPEIEAFFLYGAQNIYSYILVAE